MPKIKVYRYLIPLLFLGLAIAILLMKVTTIAETLSAFLLMPFWIVGFAVISQICSYLGNGYLLKVIVSHVQCRLSVFRGALITMASDSIGLAGGTFGAAAAKFYWISKNDEDLGEAALAGIIPLLYNTIVLIVISIIGMTYLLFKNQLSSTQLLIYGLVVVIMGATILFALYGLRHQEKVKSLVLWITKIVTVIPILKRLKLTKDLTSLQFYLDKFYSSISLLKNQGLIKRALGPTLNTLFDMATLYLFFIAAGYSIHPGILLAGYSLSYLFGRYAFIVPGGAGIIEAGMVVIFTNLGISSNVSVVVVLGYRFLSFWLPSLLGFPTMLYLQRSTRERKT